MEKLIAKDLLSIKAVFTPQRAAVTAADTPAGPPPQTITS